MKHVILTILLISCSFIEEPIYSIDSELEPYYLLFLYEAEGRGFNYSGRDIFIYFGNIDTMGRSINRLDYIIEIVINDIEWHKSNADNIFNGQLKEMTMMHELGHALLNRKHTENKMSVMSTRNNEKYANYELHREEMLNELFSY